MSHTERLRELLGSACDLLDSAQSGYISGSASDQKWKAEADSTVKMARDFLSDEQITQEQS